MTGRLRLINPTKVAMWVVIVATFALTAATWVAIGRIAGFGQTVATPYGVVHIAWLMPFAADGYVVVALLVWTHARGTALRRFARNNVYVSAALGVAGQSAYHTLTTMASGSPNWHVAMALVFGAVPPAVTALTIHLYSLLAVDAATLITYDTLTTAKDDTGDTTEQTPTAVATPATPVATAVSRPRLAAGRSVAQTVWEQLGPQARTADVARMAGVTTRTAQRARKLVY